MLHVENSRYMNFHHYAESQFKTIMTFCSDSKSCGVFTVQTAPLRFVVVYSALVDKFNASIKYQFLGE